MPAATFDPVKDLPHPLLTTNEHSDFTRNFREMQKHSKRPYSLTRVLRSFCKTPPRFDGFEQEVHEELSLKTAMASDSARVRSGLVSFSIRFESFIGIYSSR